MHTEVFSISSDLIDDIISKIESSQRIVAVGTTSVRTLESLPYIGYQISKNSDIATDKLYVDQWDPYSCSDFNTLETLKNLSAYMKKNDINLLTASTSIMIAPGFKWRIVNDIITNFHQPQSTLLLLVSSFIDNNSIDKPEWRKMYDEALQNDYRFLSYGDSSFLSRE
jgi:S-adenosylmethionine:tRNA ribosyltransferase-isomerase